MSNNECSHIRPYVDKKTWNIFKGVAQIQRITNGNALTEAMRLWIKDVSNVKELCYNCRKEIDINNCVVLIENGCRTYFCGKECLPLR